jgi:hypothetical protein
VSVWRPALGLVVAGFILGATAALSQWPWSAERAERSVLRLSWRARGERLESCRRATPEELAAVPAHMRQEVICEGARVAPYRLRIAVDGQALEDGTAPGSGVPGDRPIYVLRQFEVEPGPHRLEVLFERSGSESASPDDDDGEDDEEEHRGRKLERQAVPPRLLLDTVITAEASAVLLVTYSAEHRRLVLLGPD